jgi:hypothetical protein
VTSTPLKTYRKRLDELFHIRVFTGTGPARTSEDFPVHGKQVPGGSADTLIGAVTEQAQQVILLAEDVPFPLNTNHKLVIITKEYAITKISPRIYHNETLGFDILIKG